MSSSLQKYTSLIKNLLPQGLAWEQVRLHPLLAGIAGEFCRVGDRAIQLLKEIDPSQTDELFDDWEAMVGIPDECTPEFRTQQERRDQIIQKLAVQSNLSASFYEEIGAFYGFDVTVTNHLSFQVGRSTVRDDLTNYDNPRDVFEAGQDQVGQRLQSPGWLFYFNVDLPASAVESFMVGQNTVGQPLVSFGNDLLQCTYYRLKPAHSGITFTFS